MLIISRKFKVILSFVLPSCAVLSLCLISNSLVLSVKANESGEKSYKNNTTGSKEKSDSKTNTQADTLFESDAEPNLMNNRDELDYQLDSSLSILKKTKEQIVTKFKDFTNWIGPKDTVRTPAQKLEEILDQYYKLTRNMDIPGITSQALLKNISDTNFILVDVRQSEEQTISMLPGAITTIQFSKKYKSPASLKGKIVIVYCTIGYRSAEYADCLKPYKIDVRNLIGGLLAWSHYKGILVKTSLDETVKPTHEIHVYAKKWNLVHPDYQAVW